MPELTVVAVLECKLVVVLELLSLSLVVHTCAAELLRRALLCRCYALLPPIDTRMRL